MANILFCSRSNVTFTKEPLLDSFVEGFIRALRRGGNTVYSVRVNSFYVHGVPITDRELIRSKLQSLAIDLIITLNNEFPYPEMLQDIGCQVACFAADSCAFFANHDLIKKYTDRYFFFNFSRDTIRAIPEWFPMVQANRNILFGHATDLRAMPVAKDINISFIGSMANWNRDLPEYFNSYQYRRVANDYIPPWNGNSVKDAFFEALDRFKANPMKTFDCELPMLQLNYSSIETTVILLLTCKARFDVLSQLTDLGLRIFSYPNISDVMLYNYDIFRCFDYTTSVSIEHATQNYNRSKVSLNLPHAHAAEGFSWRVCDILASNAVLLSCQQPDLVHLTQGRVKLPMFESPQEARELAVKLLKDDIWREELSLACQAIVEEKCRFEDKFKIIEQAIGNINLFPNASSSEEKELEGGFETITEVAFINRRRFKVIQIYKRMRSRNLLWAPSHIKGLMKRILIRLFLWLT